MEDGIEDIDLSGTNIHNFLYNQGMRASRVREIYRLCVSNINPQPTLFIFGDEIDRDKHALRRFRNALTMDLVANVQYAYQQCGLRDDGQGMTPEELLEKVAEMKVDHIDAPLSCDKEDQNGFGGDNCVNEGIGETGMMEFHRDGEPDTTDEPLCDSGTRRVLEPHPKSTRKKPTPIARHSHTSESSATDTQAVNRTQAGRPLSRVKPLTLINFQLATPPTIVPANPPPLRPALTRHGVRKSASTQLTLNTRPTVKDEVSRTKKPQSHPPATRSQELPPGRSQRPLSVPVGKTKTINAPVANVPVRRWR
ncbi:hypothetical protein L211DRAFT_142954 [Terfezia boudieri ATCC MYA-4762]|uniref:Uncharacterized protein n=1 Tax=Terfezia boudieri ATCC MYA-4762 TaxID=1051890 RepID=A0A3N4LT24_9PEZI|nr:hypothetical protein L211DRAFT_142954 [Terfezia boudieri ATCC MYA-4762]